MKLSLKHIYICSLIGLGASTLASCNDFLDREPITNVTPEAYFTTVDQVGAYVINYYSYLQNSRQQSLYPVSYTHLIYCETEIVTCITVTDDFQVAMVVKGFGTGSHFSVSDVYKRQG